MNDAKNQINNASLNVGMEIFVDDDDVENLYVSRMEPEYSFDKRVPLGSLVNVWYKSIKNFDVEWYKREKLRRDSIVEIMRIKKFKADTIKYVLDSFNYILSHRQFSYDSIERIKDKEMLFMVQDSLVFDYIDDFDYELDTTYFYDE